MGARETALFWIDYVIRHKGAPHLRASGLDLKWYQFYLLDVVALCLAALLLMLSIAFVLVHWLLRSLGSKQQKQKLQ